MKKQIFITFVLILFKTEHSAIKNIDLAKNSIVFKSVDPLSSENRLTMFQENKFRIGIAEENRKLAQEKVKIPDVNDLITFLSKFGVVGLRFDPSKTKKKVMATYSPISKDPIFEVWMEPEERGESFDLIFQSWPVKNKSPSLPFPQNKDQHWYFRKSLKREILLSDATLNEYVSNTIQQFLDSNKSIVNDLATVPKVSRALKSILEGKGYKITNLSLEERSEAYMVNSSSNDVSFRVIVYSKDQGFISIDCADADHLYQFRVPRNNFKELDRSIIEEIEGKLFKENFSEKITLIKSTDLIGSLIEKNTCTVASSNKNSSKNKQTFSFFRLNSGDSCFGSVTKILMIQYNSPMLRAVHIKIENDILHSEIVISADPSTFEARVTKYFGEINATSISATNLLKNSDKVTEVSLPAIRELIRKKLDVLLTLPEKLKDEKLNVAASSPDKSNSCRLVLKDGVFSIILVHKTPFKVDKHYNTQISFPRYNGYDQIGRIGEQITRFILDYEGKI
jgi:hypothetical protein